MPMLILNTDDYLYRDKRDIYVLQIKHQGEVEKGFGFLNYDRDLPANIAICKSQTVWLNERGVKTYLTGPSELMCGWIGHYYVEFDGGDDPRIADYAAEFEGENGLSLYPDQFQMFQLSYNHWVESGRLAKHEQYLIDIQDPDYGW